MSTYLESSACVGRRPRHLASLRCFHRPDLIARLLRDRAVARFIVAPDGFGKTSLAFGYADTVFAFEHVMWLNAKSPCFLRDLDSGVIAAGLLKVDGHAALAVIDDLPPLGSERARALSREIDGLMSAGCEVIACCAPSCDAYASLQKDRLKLGPSDLLVSDDELALGIDAAFSEEAPGSASRVPGLRWGRGAAPGAFLSGIAKEELPSDLVLAMVVMLALVEGSIDDLGAFDAGGEEPVRILSEEYPFLRIDLRSGGFSAPPFDPEDIARAFSGKLDAAAGRSCFADRTSLACGIADVLLARGEGSRACGLVGALCPREAKADWLAGRAIALARQACFLPASDLAAHLGRGGRSRGGELEAGEAWRAAFLGDAEAACRHARKAAASRSEGPQVMGLLAIARLGLGKERADAASRLGGWASQPFPADGSEGLPVARWTRPLAAMWDAARVPPARARELWGYWSAGRAHPDALSIAALWLFEDASRPPAGMAPEGDGGSSDGESARRGLLLDAARHVARRIEDAQGRAPDAFAALACLMWEGLVRSAGFAPECDPLDSPSAIRAARDAEAVVMSQRRELERRRREDERRRAEYAATHPDAFLDGRYRVGERPGAAGAPLLTVNVFGGLEAFIGDEKVDPAKLRRQKVKTLLSLLVMGRGRDISRDRLMAAMWPDAAGASTRKNFYTIWSLLRKALALPDGTCPYLIRQQNACRLEGGLLRSDIVDFDDVCRTLLFGSMDTDGWARLSSEIEHRFSGELLPGEKGTEPIERMRAECRARLVDSLVGASRRLVSQGRTQEGLWFARAALARNRLREDVYVAMMEAQVAAGQRASALATYFDCRRALADELGIDPSLDTMALYRSIIEEEDGVDF